MTGAISLGRGRLGIAEERRPEEPHRPPGQRLDQPLRGVELEACDLGRRFAEIRVGEGVIADLVALGEDALDEAGICLAVLADDEERRLDALLLQDVEDLRRPLGARAIVERQRHLVRHPAGAADDIGGRDLRERLRRDETMRLVGLERAGAIRRLGGDIEDLALTFDVDVAARNDRLQLRRDCRRHRGGRAATRSMDLPIPSRHRA